MKKTAFATLIALVGMAAVPTLASANSYESDVTDTIHGRGIGTMQTTLRDMGTPVQDLEEWGGYVRGWTVDASGNQAMVLIDPDTLQIVR